MDCQSLGTMAEEKLGRLEPPFFLADSLFVIPLDRVPSLNKDAWSIVQLREAISQSRVSDGRRRAAAINPRGVATRSPQGYGLSVPRHRRS
jgi:hypothetical protein